MGQNSEIQCLACGHRYPDPVHMKYDKNATICYCCGHVYENTGGIEDQLSSSESNNTLFHDLLEIAEEDLNIPRVTEILAKYVPLISRPCFDKRYSVEILSTSIPLGGGFPSETILYYGAPLGHAWNEAEENYHEYWLDTAGALVMNKITAPNLEYYKLQKQDIREAWYSTLDVEYVGKPGSDNELLGELVPTIITNCKKYVYRYAYNKLNARLLTQDELIKFIIKFHYSTQIDDPIVGLCWDMFHERLSNISDDSSEAAKLIDSVKHEISSGYLSDLSFEILENIAERETAVRIFSKALKLKESSSFRREGIDDITKDKVRATMHKMDAKSLIGFCPCDVCTKKSRR